MTAKIYWNNFQTLLGVSESMNFLPGRKCWPATWIETELLALIAMSSLDYTGLCVWNCSLPGNCLADIPASQQLHIPASPLLCQSGGEWCRNVLINVELLKVEVKTITAQFYFASSLSSLIFSLPPPSPLEGFISQTVNYNLIIIF